MIEKATIDDAPEILGVINSGNRIYKKVIPEEYYHIVVVTKERIREDFQRMMFYVYRLEEKVVGVGALLQESDELIRMRRVCVLPEYQSRGIGKEIVAFLEDRARELGFPSLYLYTADGAKWAIGFYEHLGYRVSGNIERVWGFDVMMEKRLFVINSSG